ncbi:uncharacterized protein LOC107427986 isoform X1 [Ziziphus jujuba]|uniref:Uncharacterized protein LOC107427986 isoform X1 n=1 Tax=Ziziphus jujuba TaxID=326968 RepID=A0A6P4AEW8_ZIZJJ|nr:uncharacterized protein LOC107427986 isoform X1 [Ziziphus jujuba]
MSILPNKAQGSTSSSSLSPPSLNPNYQHGLYTINNNNHNHSQSQYQYESPSSQIHAFGSLRISPIPVSTNNSAGTSTSAAENSGGSSEAVTDLETSNGNNFIPHHNTDTHSQCHSARRGVGSAKSRGKMSGNVVSQRVQQRTGSSNSHGNSTHSGGGRKAHMTSGNHLLNFHYDPISRQQSRVPPPPPRRQHKMKPYNKDLFLQANYKFVVLDSGNYTPESMDPDKMLRWEDIICVRFSTPSEVHCPICLESPLCPQITSCGHIFCFPCILRYLLMGKEDHKGDCWKRCPLCFVLISPKDLYTVNIENVEQYCVGDKVDFILLTRRKDSFALSNKNKLEKDVMPGCTTESYDPFSKFTFTSDVDLSVRKSISDLDSWLVRAESGLVDDLEKLPYVCAAMEQLEQRKKYWNEHRSYDNDESCEYADCNAGSYVISATTIATNANSEVSRFERGTLSNDVSNQNKQLGNSVLDNLDGGNCSVQSVDVTESLEGQENISSSSYNEIHSTQGPLNGFRDVNDKDFYNFYQAADGQHIILHPLNLRCLLQHYGSHDMLPHRINGKILQLDTVTQSEAMRRRYRYLSHFSLTTTFQLCEIDLSELLPPEALIPFVDEIKKREKQRKQVARKERKEKIKAEAAMEYPVHIVSSFGQASHYESPSFSMDDFEALGTSPPISSSPPVIGERKLFSNVTKFGFAAGHDSPGLKIEENNPNHDSEVATDSSGVAGLRNVGIPSFANVTSRAKSSENSMAQKTNDLGKKGKKSARVLLSTAGGRRY